MDAGDEKSDESVIYMGKFISFEDFPKKTLTERIEELQKQHQEELKALNAKLTKETERAKETQVEVESLKLLLKQEQTKNTTLVNQLDKLVSEVSKAKADEVLQTVTNNITDIKTGQVKLQEDSKKANSKKSDKELENMNSIVNEEKSKPVKRSNFVGKTQSKTFLQNVETTRSNLDE
jgi:predicted  nucleic acid-binding Zn-ribbon protein